MAKLKYPAAKAALALAVLLCFGLIALLPSAPAAASEASPQNGAALSAQADLTLTAQASHKVTVKLYKTKLYAGQTPSVKGVYVDGKKVDNKYFSFSGVLPKTVGIGYVKATGKSGTKYAGLSDTQKFTLRPYGTSVSATPLVGGFKANWGYQSSYTAGYQLQYSKSSSFSTKKTLTISDTATTSRTKTGLDEGTTYYLRIRTYSNTVDGKVYSPWSSTSSVTTKGQEVPKYQPTQKLKITRLWRSLNKAEVEWSQASSWYQYTGAASGKVSGYELQWDDNKNFSSPASRTTFYKSDYKYTITTLSKNTTYYFRVRLFNTVNAKTYFGPWSTVVSTSQAAHPVG